MKGSKNSIDNRGSTKSKVCSICNDKIKHMMVIRQGKSRMIRVCKCSLYKY